MYYPLAYEYPLFYICPLGNRGQAIFARLLKSSFVPVEPFIQFLNFFPNILQRASIASDYIDHIWRITISVHIPTLYYTVKRFFC